MSIWEFLSWVGVACVALLLVALAVSLTIVLVKGALGAKARGAEVEAWDKGFESCDLWSSSPPGTPWPQNPYRSGTEGSAQ